MENSKWISDKISELENEKTHINELVKYDRDLNTLDEKFEKLYENKLKFLDESIDRVRDLKNDEDIFRYEKESYIFNEIWDREFYKLMDILNDNDSNINWNELIGTDEELMSLTDEEFKVIQYENSAEFEEKVKETCSKVGLSIEELDNMTCDEVDEFLDKKNKLSSNKFENK